MCQRSRRMCSVCDKPTTQYVLYETTDSVHCRLLTEPQNVFCTWHISTIQIPTGVSILFEQLKCVLYAIPEPQNVFCTWHISTIQIPTGVSKLFEQLQCVLDVMTEPQNVFCTWHISTIYLSPWLSENRYILLVYYIQNTFCGYTYRCILLFV